MLEERQIAGSYTDASGVSIICVILLRALKWPNAALTEASGHNICADLVSSFH